MQTTGRFYWLIVAYGIQIGFMLFFIVSGSYLAFTKNNEIISTVGSIIIGDTKSL